MNLITGGTGFLGAHLAALLLHKQQSVRIMKRTSSSPDEISLIFKYHFGNAGPEMLKKIQFFEGSLMNPFDIEESLKGVKYVFHCAAKVSFNPRDQKNMFHINVEGTENIVNVLLNSSVEKLCHVSSIAALGRTSMHNKITESTPWDDTGQNSGYSVSKYRGELEVWRGIAEGLPAVIVQPGILLGPGLWNKGSCKLFSLVKSGLKYYTNGINGYIDVEEAADRMISLIKTPVSGERFILVSENLSYKELFTQIAQGLNVRGPSIHAGFTTRRFVVAIDCFRSFISGKDRVFSPDFARLAGQIARYDASKIISLSGKQFTPINECIEKTCSFFNQTSLT
jgi:dihydroflavonol-4-reductase